MERSCRRRARAGVPAAATITSTFRRRELGDQRSEALVLSVRPAILDRDVPAFDVAEDHASRRKKPPRDYASRVCGGSCTRKLITAQASARDPARPR